MTPEQEARQHIDDKLKDAGWIIQDFSQLNPSASLGVAIREFPFKKGFADYLLMVNRKAVGVIEAKPVGTTLGGVDWQSEKYVNNLPPILQYDFDPLPYVYESTGVETLFRNLRDPDFRSRPVFSFLKPETILDELQQTDTLRARLKEMPSLLKEGLRNCQIEAIEGLERSFKVNRPKALIQMATGSGKSFAAVTAAYRLIKHAKAKRILFLVDRGNLGRQALKEFQQYRTPDDGRLFTELYNIQHLQSNVLDPVCNVCITTIQRLYSMLRGETEFDASLEEQSGFKVLTSARPQLVEYNPNIPIEYFDFVIADECHRSIYNVWKQVLEYFDSFLIGLTATPTKETLGYFNQNLVSEYTHERAVADKVNVGYEVYKIETQITQNGSTIESGYYIDKRDKLTREKRWQQLDEDYQYANNQLDRSVVSVNQIRTVIQTFRDKLFTEIFPGRTEVPKTLIFAKDDSHAEDILHIVREEFGKGNDFAKKITYRTTGEKPEDLISAFRNSYNPRIAVTVDMISTGTDIKPLECLLFMRSVQSRTYFEQMKGRGTRTIDSADYQAVTPDNKHKTHFVIVDAVKVCERVKTDSRSLERKPNVAFDKLLIAVALGNRDEDTVTTLAGRLSRLSNELSKQDEEDIQKASGGIPLKQIINDLLDSTDADKQKEFAKTELGLPKAKEEDLEKAQQQLAHKAGEVFNNPELRNLLVEIKQKNEQVIDTISPDTILTAGWDQQAKDKAKDIVQSFKQFIGDNKDEITALQIFHTIPYGKRKVSLEQIEELAKAIQKPPMGLQTDLIWKAYKQIEQDKVKDLGPHKHLTNMVSLIRHAIGERATLEPFEEIENERFSQWLGQQRKMGREFTPEQMEWLQMIKDHITTSLAIEMDDFQLSPFQEKGGALRVYKLFGQELDKILKELNEVLAA
jgi:type I restriction enzyme R subunit